MIIHNLVKLHKVTLYPNKLKSVFRTNQSLGANDFKSLNISNIKRLKVVQPRELSRSPNADFLGCLGINQTVSYAEDCEEFLEIYCKKNMLLHIMFVARHKQL